MNRRVYSALRKHAGAMSDALLSLPSTRIMGDEMASDAQSIGKLLGEFSGKGATKAQLLQKLQAMQGDRGMALLPGVSGYRLTARKVLTQKLLEDARDKDKSSMKSRALMDYISWLNPLNLVAAPVAALGAAITPTESLKETADTVNDDNYVLKSMFIPGWHTYNRFKAIGVSDKLADGTYTESEAAKLDPETSKVLLERLRSRTNK